MGSRRRGRGPGDGRSAVSRSMAGRRSGADSDPCAHQRSAGVPAARNAAGQSRSDPTIGFVQRSRNRSDLSAAFKQLLASPNIASKEWIYRQYDHFVRTNTVVAPGADAAVIRIKGTKKGLALTVDGNSRYCYLDPYVGGVLAVVEAARNLACVGARPIGLTDCLNFGSPENPEVMWQFAAGDSRHARRLSRAQRSGCEWQREFL